MTCLKMSEKKGRRKSQGHISAVCLFINPKRQDRDDICKIRAPFKMVLILDQLNTVRVHFLVTPEIEECLDFPFTQFLPIVVAESILHWQQLAIRFLGQPIQLYVFAYCQSSWSFNGIIDNLL